MSVGHVDVKALGKVAVLFGGSSAERERLIGILLIARSASAVIVKLGFTPGLAEIAEPSIT